MAEYKGKPTIVNASPEAICEKFSDLSKLSDYVQKMPEDQLKKIGELQFEKDAIIIKNPSIGEMIFKVTELNNERIKLSAAGMLPLEIEVRLKKVEEAQTELTTVVIIEIPKMLQPLIGGKLQQVADMFGDIIAKLMNA